MQVNAGPTEICRVFCGKKEGEEKKEGVIDKDREVMKNLFREFLVGCERALELNSAIIGRDQLVCFCFRLVFCLVFFFGFLLVLFCFVLFRFLDMFVSFCRLSFFFL